MSSGSGVSARTSRAAAPVRLTPGEVVVEVVRNGVVEGLHHGHAVVVGSGGEVLAQVGRPEQPVLARSALKPLQAVGLLGAGLDLPAARLALACASHAGTAEHVAAVRRLLTAYDVDEAALQCPADRPLDDAAWAAVLAMGAGPQPILMNCSGKHAAFLAACRVNGWPLGSYLDPDHPLQRHLTVAVDEQSGPLAAVAVDGCGAPAFAVALVALARAFAGLVDAADGAPRRVADAMRAHPGLVGGPGRSATTLMQARPGLLAKEGAEGVWAAAVPGLGAVALKIDDGAGRAADRLLLAALARLGVEDTAFGAAPVLGGGRPVGVVRVRPGLFD
ncbi:MAG: asparaginase [bacterium]